MTATAVYAGTYTLSVIDTATGCVSTTDVVVVIPDQEIAEVSYGTSTETASYCSTDSDPTPSIGENGTAGGTFSSAPAGLVINTTTGEIDLSASTPGDYIVSYITSASNCGAVDHYPLSISFVVFFIINACVVFAFVFVLFSPRLFSSSSSSSNRVSVSYSDQKKTISLIADVYLAKLSLLKRSSSMRNENDDSSDFLERLSMSRQNERRKEAMREAHERTNFIYPVLQSEEKPRTKKKKKYKKRKKKNKKDTSACVQPMQPSAARDMGS